MILEWINLIVTVVAFLIIFLHQKHRIKNLSEQISGQQKLFDSLKAFIDGVNPGLLVFRTKQYEELVDKKLEIQVKEIEDKFKEKEKSESESREKALQWILDLTGAITRAIPHLNTITQLAIVNDIKVLELKKIFQDTILPQAEQIQSEARKNELEWLRSECGIKLLPKLLAGDQNALETNPFVSKAETK